VPSNETLHDWWLTAKKDTPKPMRKGLPTVALLTPWMIWKHRNDCDFERAQPSICNLVEHIKDEATAWVRAGAKGLRDVILTTWDVH
jgi:nuclear pore complex protein Nup210